MPRHRLERQPRHRAQRPATERARRVRFRPVTARPPGHARPGSGNKVRTWQAIGVAAADRLITTGAPLRPYARRLVTGAGKRLVSGPGKRLLSWAAKRLLSGAARRLVVSPWFAIGAGFVVATGAFILAPHAEINFGNLAIGRTPCKTARCHRPTEQGARPLNAGVAGQLRVSPPPSPPATITGLSFRYATVTSRQRDTFEMVLKVTGQRSAGPWTLSFVIPGAAHITTVLGADWQRVGLDGVSASGATFDSNRDAALSGGHQQDVVYLVVNGDGTPVAPDDCSFDGTTCQFTKFASP